MRNFRGVVGAAIVFAVVVAQAPASATGGSQPAAAPTLASVGGAGAAIDVPSLTLQGTFQTKNGRALSRTFVFEGYVWPSHLVGPGHQTLLQLDGDTLERVSVRDWTCAYPDVLASDALLEYAGCRPSDDREVFAYDPLTNTTSWSLSNFGAARLDGGVLYGSQCGSFECGDGSTEAVDLSTGEVLWSNPDVFGERDEVNGVVYVLGELDSTFHALDASTGNEVWSLPVPGVDPGLYYARLAGIADGVAFVNLSGPHYSTSVARIDLTSHELLSPLKNRPLLSSANGQLLFGGDGFKATNYSAKTTLWAISGTYRLVAAADGVYWVQPAGTEQVEALDAATGELLRVFNTRSIYPTVIPDGSRVYISDGDRIRLFA